MIINLLDPGLIRIEGHHHEWDRQIAAALSAQGHELTVYSHIGIVPEARAAFRDPVKVIPLFGNYPYIDPLKLDPVAGELMGFLDVALALVKNLKTVAEADLWLWPSLFQAQLYACALVNPGVPIAGCIHVEPGFRSSIGSACWRYALLKAKQAALRMNLGVSGPVLRQEFETLFGSLQTVRLSPLPVAGQPGDAPRTSLKTVGFFGHQRLEKGAQLVPSLVSMLLRKGYRVILHDSGNAFGAEQIPGLTRIGYVPDLAEEIAKCDLIVLPYDVQLYRFRESAIVWDALASGVPVVVPYGTAPALRVLNSGAGKVFHFATADSIYSAIAEAQADYEQIAAGAFRASRKWSQTNGVARLVEEFVKGVAW